MASTTAKDILSYPITTKDLESPLWTGKIDTLTEMGARLTPTGVKQLEEMLSESSDGLKIATGLYGFYKNQFTNPTSIFRDI